MSEHAFYFYEDVNGQSFKAVVPSLGFVIEQSSPEEVYEALMRKVIRLVTDVRKGRKRVIRPMGLRSRANHMSKVTTAIANKKDNWLMGSIAFNL